MKEFLGEDFLLGNDMARQLYFDYAANQPIYDYHSRLSCDVLGTGLSENSYRDCRLPTPAQRQPGESIR